MHFLQYFLSIFLASCRTRLRSINFSTCKLNCFTFKIILLSWDFLNRSWKFQPSDSWTITRGKNIISHQFRLSISIESWFTTIYKPSSSQRQHWKFFECDKTLLTFICFYSYFITLLIGRESIFSAYLNYFLALTLDFGRVCLCGMKTMD